MYDVCKELRVEAMRTTEYQTKGFMESLELKTQSTRERQREHKHRNITQKYNNTLYIGCAQRAVLYKSIQTDRSTDAYFNAHK